MKLLLDEHIAPRVAEIVRTTLDPALDIESIHDWKGGQFTNRPDESILGAMVDEGRVLVTFDVRTIPPLLADFAVAGEDHAGVVFVSIKSLAQNDYRHLARAIVALAERRGEEDDWTNRVDFLTRE